MHAMLNLVIFGFMGTGKTMVSKKMEKILRLPRVDMDQIIEEQEHKTITDIFAQNGESYFREVEKKVVAQLSQQKGLIIATGGGVVLNEENIRNFEKNGVCICLNAQPETIYERVRAHSHRPLLNTDNPLATIKKMLDTRRPFYDRVPYQVCTDDKNPDQICAEIMDIYNTHPLKNMN